MKKIFQKLFSAALAVCILVSTMPVTTAAAAQAPAVGDQLTVNGIRYQITQFNEGNGTLEVIQNDDSPYSGIIEIPGFVTDKAIYYSVGKIGDSAFKDCTGLTGILLPMYLNEIGVSAFEGCTGLTSIGLSNVRTIGTAAFRGCTGLTHLSFYEDESNIGTNIGASAFEGCTGLENLAMQGVATIAESEFEGCTSLTRVTIPNSISSISNYAFKDCTALEAVVFNNLNSGAFQSNIFNGCTNLKSIYVPNNSYETALTQDSGKLDYTEFTSESNSIKYRVIGDSQVEVVANNYDQNEIEIPETVENDGMPYTVTGIGDCAFSDLTELTQVTLPDSVTFIGESAFQTCPNLTKVTMPGSLQEIRDSAFYGCTNLTGVTLPGSLTSIGSNAFRECPQLSAVTIPSSVTEIEIYAFENCQSLVSVSFAENSKLTTIGGWAFSKSPLSEITIPSGVTSIEENAFSDCEQLASVTFETGSSLKSIGFSAFNNTNLAEVAIPSSVLITGQNAFCDCKSLKSVRFEDNSSLELFGEGTFLQCTALESVAFPENSKLNCIGAQAFSQDTSLTQISIPSEVTSIGECAFAGSGLTSASVLPGVKWIGTRAFVGCTKLPAITVDLENTDYCSVDGVLYNKAKTELMTYPAGKTDEEYFIPGGTACIDMEAFYSAKLRNLTIPSGVITIQDWAFDVCTYLKTVTFECSTPPEFGSMIFDEDTSLENIYVPKSSLDAYRDCAVTMDVSENIIQGITCVGNQFAVDDLNYEIISMNPNKVKVIAGADPGTYSGNITIPKTVTDADSHEYTVTEIGQKAFFDCSGMTAVSIPDNVTQIGEFAFEGCKGITELKLPVNLDSVGMCSFMNCTGLESVTIPDKITKIARNMFDHCTGLENFSIGSNVTSIGDMAFKDCSGLTDITIPAGVESIGNGAFINAGLTEITFKGNVNSIDDCAFNHDSQLAKMTFEGTTPPKTVGEGMFAGDAYPIRAVVPAGSSTAYETAFSAYTQCDPVQLKFEEKTGIAAPTGLVWDDTAAQWDKVTGATGYTVTLYKDSKAVVSESVPSDTLTYDFKDDMKDSDGNYTFKVSAKGSASDSDSPESAASSKYQSKASETGVISSFDPLASYKKTVSYGTHYEELGLPNVLRAVIDSISDQIVNVIEWVSGTAFDGNKAGNYDFTPVLDSGYQIKDSGVKLPHISVTVSAKEESRHSNDSSTEKKQNQTPKTEVRVDSAANVSTVITAADSVSSTGDAAQIFATVPDVAADTSGTSAALDAGKKARIEIDLPQNAVVQQINAKKDVELTLTVPASVANAARENTAVDIKVNENILAAAKANESDVTIKIKDADTQQLAYSWTFKGTDLAKSTTPITDVNISMAVRLTTEVAQVNRVTPNNLGLVLMFDHSGVLPSTASVTFSAKEKGFKPGQTLYFYFYNPTTGQIEPQEKQYTVDPDGMVTVQISHCSNYVLLPHSARTITLDTRTYTMPVGKSYETGVKLSGVSGAKLKVYFSTKGVADVRVLKNGNVMATGKKEGMTYVMIDVYDSKSKFLTHASVQLTVNKIVKPKGNSARQYGIF